MQDSSPFPIVSFFAGAVIAGVAVFAYTIYDSGTSFAFHAQRELSMAHTKAMQAYQNEDVAIKIWELRHLADLQAEHLQQGLDSKRSLSFQLFLTHGRLSKLYHEQNRDLEAQRHAEAAFALHREFSPTNLVVTNFSTLMEWVQKSDDASQKKPKYE